MILIPLSRVQEEEHLDIIFITTDYRLADELDLIVMFSINQGKISVNYQSLSKQLKVID